MRLLSGLYGLFLVIAVGCGGSTGGDVPAAAGPGGPTGGGGTLGTGTPGADGGGPAGGDASAADTSAPQKDRRIDPIEVGRAWTFDVEVLGIYPLCVKGVHEAKAEKAEIVDGKQGIFVTSFCANSPGFHYSVDGDNVWSHYLGEWIDSLEAPVQAGHTWTDGYLDYEWESKGTVTVPAGTFDECWSATTVASYTSYILLCRGVGPVRWHFEDGWGNGYHATLVAKNF
jgi:hypothetical protein